MYGYRKILGRFESVSYVIYRLGGDGVERVLVRFDNAASWEDYCRVLWFVNFLKGCN